MSYCLNPVCQKPQNPDTLEVCRNCGAKLLLKDRYRPIKPIAQGGFGRTFLAIDEDKPSKPRCVIKQFFPAIQGGRQVKKAADLFEQEALRLEELGSHPQIPTLLAHCNQDGQQYLVQEFISGKTLADLLQERGPFTEAQIWEVLTSLLPVLEFIHSHGVIHRDVKPSNIILTPGKRTSGRQGRATQPDWGSMLQALSLETSQGFRDTVNNRQRFSELLNHSLEQAPRNLAIADYGRWQQIASQFATYPEMTLSQRRFLVADASRLLYEMRRKYEPNNGQSIGQMVLVDFGAAKAAVGTALVKTGTTIGSPEYLAPEQARGKAVFASDLYSLGVSCIHLLTGRSPFDLFDADHDSWIWRRYLAGSLSDRLGQVLDRLLQAGLRQRYQSAAQVLQTLQDLEILPAQPPLYDLPPPLAPQPRSSQPTPILGSEPIPALGVKPDAGAGIKAGIGAATKPGTKSKAKPGSKPAPLTPAVAAKPRSPRKPAHSPDWQCMHRCMSLGKVLAIALHPTVPILASSSGTTIKLWDTQTGQPLRTLTGHLDIIDALVLRSRPASAQESGQLLISGSADKSIRLWDLASGQRLGSLNLHSDTVLSLALSPDGQLLASGSLYDPIKLWDLQRQQEKGELKGHTGRVDTLAFSPDGKVLVASGADATITLWDMDTGQVLRLLKGHTQAIAMLAFSPDNKTLASASWDGTVKLWSTTTWREKRTLSPKSGRVNALLFTPDNKILVTGSDTLQLWNPRNGKKIATLGEHTGISAIATNAKANMLASASWDGAIRIWAYQ